MFGAYKCHSLVTCFEKVILKENIVRKILCKQSSVNYLRSDAFRTTSVKNDLMEFFDDKKNWGANEVKCGRSWKKEELRLKSNSDLHKLWYVLLKERNMLLTMEHEADRQIKLFPSPERLDKVEESMENLEEVVRERNIAYHQLETGETGEQPVVTEINCFGLEQLHKKVEHLIPKSENKEFLAEHPPYDPLDKDVKEFLLKYREKEYLNIRKEKNRNFNHVCGLLKRFPNMDMEALKEKYPDVDIEKAKNSKKSRGHFVPK